MKHVVVNCPYCRNCPVVVDDEGPELVVGPPGGSPCRHLAYASVGLQVLDTAAGDVTVEARTGVWLWAYGHGLRQFGLDELINPLLTYVDHWLDGLLDDPGDRPHGVEYRIVGGTAGSRNRLIPGTGSFPVRGRRGQKLVAILDGSAAFARRPAALAAEVRRLSVAPAPMGGS